MASQKQLDKWYNEAVKINSNPEYIQTYAKYRQLAKRADQQLVRLEATSREKHFEGVLEFAYKGAIRDIRSWGGDKRFNTAPPTKLTQLEAKIADIEKFLAKPTATKSGIKKIYKKRADTFNKKYGKQYGIEFTWEDIANYYEDRKGQREAVKLASKTEVRAIATIKKLNIMSEDKRYIENLKRYQELDKKARTAEELKEFEQIAKEIKETKDRIKKIVNNDRILSFEVNRLLEQGLDYSKLVGGN